MEAVLGVSDDQLRARFVKRGIGVSGVFGWSDWVLWYWQMSFNCAKAERSVECATGQDVAGYRFGKIGRGW